MIISASRRTDIPAFYSTWFFNRLKEGFVCVRNPMNPKQVSRIELSKDTIDCIVFWTKNPLEMLPKLDLLKDYNFYFQYTLNPYSNDIEVNLPAFEQRLQTFINLSTKIGKERVVWRYDPIIIARDIDVQFHITMFDEMAKILKDYTNTVIISILDNYKKIKRRLQSIEVRDISAEEVELIATSFKNIADKYNLKILSCAEDIDLRPYGINPGKCIDDQLISKLLGQEIKIPKDKNQRAICGCVESIDIGAYNTCLNNCKYCYANYDESIVRDNCLKHDENSPFLFGTGRDDDKISDRKIKIYKAKEEQLSFHLD